VPGAGSSGQNVTPAEWAALWRRVIVGAGKSWIAFGHGTCVIVMRPRPGDLAEQARALLAEWGPVHVGSPAGDFGVIKLESKPGWVVTGHHPDVLTYVAPDEVGASASDLVVGICGRSKRDQDARALDVVHVEDQRAERPEPT